MSVRSWSPGRTVSVPRGAWSALTNRRSGVPARASAMQNMRVRFGTVRTRPGTSAVFASTGKVPGMFNWITPQGDNLVLYQDGSNVKAYNQALATSATLFSVPGNTLAPSFAPLDVWAYICGFDSAGAGTFQCEVCDGTYTDKAFRPAPVITGWTAVDGGAGQCTLGQHFIGFCYQNRTGYTGIPVTGISYAITAVSSVSFAVTATTNASPDVLTVPGHTFVNSDTVTGSGATGDTAINGVFLVTGVAGANLSLTDLQGNPVNGNGVLATNGTLTSPLLLTAPGNNFLVGQTVNLAPNGTDAAIIATTPTPGSTFTLTDTDGNIIDTSTAYIVGAIVVNPIQFSTVAGLRQVRISVSLPAMPDGGTNATGGTQATLFMIATATNNPNLWYFIPTDFQTGQIGERPVPLNTPVTLNFVLSMSDFDINDSLAGDTAQAQFLLTAQAADGTGPFNPNFVVAYGQRMCYGTGTVLYVSDTSNPQQISADTNQVIMPNQRVIGAAFPLPGNTSLYLTGDKWTAFVNDNSDSPSTWGEPVGVSGALGAAFPNLVCADTGGSWVWVVTEGGPYAFDGAYGAQPITYLVSGHDETGNPIGWTRVNWAAASTIQIRDDVQHLKLYVAVPLDGAIQPNYMFCIDYRMGRTFDTCDISLDVFTPQTFASIAVIKEHASGLSNLWIGPAAAGSVLRSDVGNPNDVDAAIDNYWTSGLSRGPNMISAMIRVGAMDVWAHGNAPLVDGDPSFLITLFGPDGQQSVPVTLCSTQGVPCALTPQPGIHYMAKTDLSKIEDYYCQFRTNSAGAWFELSAAVFYERDDIFNR